MNTKKQLRPIWCKALEIFTISEIIVLYYSEQMLY